MYWIDQKICVSSVTLLIMFAANFVSYMGRIAASAAFEKRKTEKVYVAVVRGHINVDNIPMVEAKPQPYGNSGEKKKRKSSDTDEKGSDVRDESWQRQAMEAGLEVHFAALQEEVSKLKQHQSELSTGETASTAALLELSSKSYEDFCGNHKLRKQLRKVLRARGVQESSPVVSTHTAFGFVSKRSRARALQDAGGGGAPDGRMCGAGLKGEQGPVENDDNIDDSIDHRDCDEDGDDDGYNHGSEGGLGGEGPSVFRLKGDGGEEGGPGEVYITAPVLSVSGDFRMRVMGGEPHTTADSTSTTSNIIHRSSLTGSRGMQSPGVRGEQVEEEPDWRACETRLKVMGHGIYRGQPVTKVMLRPVSGRRHQLRLHCMLLGHPIGT